MYTEILLCTRHWEKHSKPTVRETDYYICIHISINHAAQHTGKGERRRGPSQRTGRRSTDAENKSQAWRQRGTGQGVITTPAARKPAAEAGMMTKSSVREQGEGCLLRSTLDTKGHSKYWVSSRWSTKPGVLQDGARIG